MVIESSFLSLHICLSSHRCQIACQELISNFIISIILSLPLSDKLTLSLLGEELGNEDTLIDDKRQLSDDDYNDLEEESDNEKLSTLLLDSILHPDVIALIRDKLVSRVSEIADRQEA